MSLTRPPRPLMWSITITRRSLRFFAAAVKKWGESLETVTRVNCDFFVFCLNWSKLPHQRGKNQTAADTLSITDSCFFFSTVRVPPNQFFKLTFCKIPLIPLQFIEILFNFYANLTVDGWCVQASALPVLDTGFNPHKTFAHLQQQ